MQHDASRSVCEIDPVADPRWQRFVGSQSAAGIFHHPAWLALLSDCYQFKAFALCIERGGELIAGIPFCEVVGLGLRRRKLVCLPFSDHCGPLALSPADSEYLVGDAIARAKSTGMRLEIRHSLEKAVGCEPRRNHCLHVLDLGPEPEQLLKGLKSRAQRSIKKAQKNGLSTEMRSDMDAVDIFYRLHLQTRRKQGVPIQPRHFFTLLHRHVIRSGLGFVSLTRSKAGYVSAGVFFGFNGTMTYKFGASDPTCLESSPNHLMLWDTMLYARQQGFVQFDFGKTASSNDGLIFFKRGWNAKETELPYSYFPAAPSAALKDLLQQKLLAPVIKHGPAIVCRMAGNALYKHFGA